MRALMLGPAGPEISVIGFGAWEAGGMWGPGPREDGIVGSLRRR